MTRLLVLMAAAALLASPAAGADAVALEGVTSEWQNLYGAIVYATSGTIRNTGTAPLRAVKVRVELFDKDGKSVARRDGYNLAAERLEQEPGAIDAVKPIPPGGSDNLRLWMDKSDIPRPFRTAKVTVVEVR